MVKLSLINEEQKEKNYYGLKIIILTAVVVIFAFVLGFSIAKIFSHEKIFGLSGYYSMAVSALLFLSFFSLESVFGQNSRILYSIGEAVIFMVGYLFGRESFSVGLGELILLLVLVGFFVLGRSAIFKSKEEMMKIHWQKIIKHGVSLVLTGLIIFWSIGFGLAIWEKPDNGFFVTPKGLEKLLNYNNFLVRFYLPDFTWSMTVDKFMTDLSEKTVNSAMEKMFGNELKQALEGNADVVNKQKQLLITENVSSLKSKLSEILNKPLTGQETLADTAYQWLFGKFQSIPENMKNYLLVALMLVLFITLKIFAPLISLIVRFFSFLIYEVLMALGFASMSYETRNKENIVVP